MLRHRISNAYKKKVISIQSILIILSIFIILFTSIPSPSYAKSAKTLPLSKETVDGSPATGSSLAVANSKGYSIDQRYSPAGTIITEIKTGQILWDENSTVEWTPASMSKLMTIALTYDAIKEGKLSIDTVVPVKERHARVSANSNLSNNKMQVGASYTVGELMELIAVPSSAAATYMLMDLLAPDIDTFVTMMNNKAKELEELTDVYFFFAQLVNHRFKSYKEKRIEEDLQELERILEKKNNIILRDMELCYEMLLNYIIKNLIIGSNTYILELLKALKIHYGYTKKDILNCYWEKWQKNMKRIGKEWN